MNTNKMQAGRELDALIAKKVIGYTGPMFELAKRIGAIPQYSTDIAAAWQVVEMMMLRGWSYGLTDGAQPQPQYDCSFFKETKEQPRFFAIDDTAPLAICRAALKAVGE